MNRNELFFLLDLLLITCGISAIYWPAGLIFAGIAFGRRDSPLLQLMRRVLREARIAATTETQNAPAAKKASAG